MSFRSLDDIRALPGIYHLRRNRYARAFLHGTFGTQWGEFPTAQSARAAVPKAIPSSYDNPELVDLKADFFAQVHLFDWPVLFYLRRLIDECRMTALVDFGGHIGAKYYAFRDHLALPHDFAWQVVETPAMAVEGRRRAAASNATHLSFCDRIEDAPAADILFCSGSLQYFDGTVLDIVARLARRPQAIILSKLPICEDADFYTLDNLQTVKVPYHVFSAAEHEALCRDSGYERVERWHIAYRDFEVPFSHPRRAVRMYGEVWLDPALSRALALDSAS